MFEELISIAIDELSYIYMGTQKRGVRPDDKELEPEEYIRRHNALNPEAFFANHGKIPKMRMRLTQRRRTHNLYEISFESCVKTPFRINNLVPGRYYELHGRPEAPTFIILHGWRMDSYILFDRFARILLRQGFNAVMIDLPYHMRRTPEDTFSGEYTMSDNAIHTLETMRQAVSDVFSAANWLRSRGAPGVGLLGVSLGAMISGLLICVSPDFHCAVLVTPPPDLTDMFHYSRIGQTFGKENPKAAALMEKHAGILRAFALTRLTPKLPRDRIFIAEGLVDGMVPTTHVEALWRAWNRPIIKRYPRGHITINFFNPKLDSDLRRFATRMQRSLDTLSDQHEAQKPSRPEQSKKKKSPAKSSRKKKAGS